MAKGFKVIPERKYDHEVGRVLSHFKETYKDLYNHLLNTLMLDPYNPSISDEIDILNRIERRIAQLESALSDDLTGAMAEAFDGGQAYHLAGIGAYKNLTEAIANASNDSFKIKKVEALVADTYGDLLYATQNTSRRLKKVVRESASKSLQYGASRDLGRKTMAKLIENDLSRKGLSKKLTEEGFVGIIDKAGRKWKLSTYADMVVRTKLQQAHTEGLRYESLNTGCDLGVISSHGATDSCGKFEGMIISLNGITEGYPTYEELRATGLIFHPNCKHTVNSFRDPSLLPEAVINKSEKARENYKRVIASLK